jgi:transcriptional regulator with XRE-family HTH domain
MSVAAVTVDGGSTDDGRCVSVYQETASRGPAGCERRREELGEFLKTRRARLSPEDFGMPGGSRRRTPGLRREEVAQLAGVGVTWYTWLEQGREINVSMQVLDAVARTLRLDRAEREHLYTLAEATPLLVGTAREASVPDEVKVIVESLCPLPATLTNGRFDILARNDAARGLFREWHTTLCVHMNNLWCLITEPTARDKFLQYEAEARYTVARLRAAYGRHVGDPAWEEDIRRLRILSPEFDVLWARHEVAAPEPRLRTFLHPLGGELTFTFSELQLPAAPDLQLLVYTPVDEHTRAALPKLQEPFDAYEGG